MRDCESCKNHTDKGCTKWKCEFEPTTKNDLGVDLISREQALVAIRNLYPGMPRVDFNGSLRKWVDKYKPYIECDDAIKQLPSVTPQEPCDKCEVTFKDDNAVSRLSVRDIIYANAYELEYPDGSSEYVVNRDELIKYLMELPPVYSKMVEPQESEG